jgi:small subunit ribosomal protein S15e
MADEKAPKNVNESEQNEEEDGKRRAPFRRFFYRGLEVPSLLDLPHQKLLELMSSRTRRRFRRGHVPMHLIRRLRKAKKAAGDGKPATIKTHLRNMIIVPEMVGSMVGVYNGKTFTAVEIKVRCAARTLGACARWCVLGRALCVGAGE